RCGLLGVRRAASQAHHEVGIHRAERELTSARAGSSVRLVIEQPFQLRPRKVWIEHQASHFSNPLEMSPVPKLTAELRGSTILPYDRALHRAPRPTLPEQCGLALIGDADRGDIAPAQARVSERARDGSERALPQLFRLVLDPTRLRKVLCELLRMPSQGGPVEAQHQRRGAGRPLIQRQNVFSLHAPKGTWTQGAQRGHNAKAEHPASGVLERNGPPTPTADAPFRRPLGAV